MKIREFKQKMWTVLAPFVDSLWGTFKQRCFFWWTSSLRPVLPLHEKTGPSTASKKNTVPREINITGQNSSNQTNTTPFYDFIHNHQQRERKREREKEREIITYALRWLGCGAFYGRLLCEVSTTTYKESQLRDRYSAVTYSNIFDDGLSLWTFLCPPFLQQFSLWSSSTRPTKPIFRARYSMT